MSLILVLMLVAMDVGSIQNEPDPEKRSNLALSSADHDIDIARKAYQAGDVSGMRAAMEDLQQAVSLVSASLAQSHKHARNSKYYKSAELKTRALSRRLTTLNDETGIDDRKPIEDARTRVQEVHDQILNAIMGKK